MSAPVAASVEGAVGVIELSRPEKFNCISTSVMTALDAGRTRFEADSKVRAILIRAAGKHFCTGADLDEVKGLRTDEAGLQRFLGEGMEVLMRLEASPLPVVAAVHGFALAGGLELMLAADVVFAGRSAKLGDQHAQFGLIPGWGGSQRLARLLGVRRALDLMLSARWLEAEEARAVGLVNHVVDDERLDEEAMAYCVKLAERSRTGLAQMKRLAREGVELRLADAMALERDAAVRHIMSADVSEGLAAFEGRRPPRFA